MSEQDFVKVGMNSDTGKIILTIKDWYEETQKKVQSVLDDCTEIRFGDNNENSIKPGSEAYKWFKTGLFVGKEFFNSFPLEVKITTNGDNMK